MAILAILINIIINIEPPGSDIQDVTTQMIQGQAPLPGTIKTSNRVTFGSQSNLASSALVGNSGLSAEQICLHKGDHAGNAAIEIRGNSLMNTGQDLQVKVAVTCNRANDLMQSLEDYGEDTDFGGQNGICNCDFDSAQNCCAVILKYA